MTPQEETLQLALQETGLRALPSKITSSYNKTWLRAIALVTKIGGRKEYCLCDNDGNGRPIIKRDFGACAAIVSIDDLFPYEETEKADIPVLKTDKQIITYLCKSKYDKAAIEALLSTEGKTKVQIASDRATIDRYVKDLAIGYQKRKNDEKKRVKRIKEYNSNDKAD